MKPVHVSMQVNGQAIEATIEPRLLLGDFLREQQRLTALHLACEHGVCGGCNVYIDGRLSRSCTTLAASCHAHGVQTLEGFDDDVPMQRLRDAFSAEHALQCGFCTPGMLMTARDIVMRLPQAGEADVRRELAGNLCRCTGYAGIVRAVLRVLHSDEAAAWRGQARERAAVPAAAARRPAHVLDAPAEAPRTAPAAPVPQPADALAAVADGDMTTISRSFSLPLPRAAVRAFFGDLREVAGCMPGMAVDEVIDGRRLRGTFTVKVGPIRAAFATTAAVSADDARWCGRVTSEGRDRITRSTTVSTLDYRLDEAADGRATDVQVTAAFRISGRLAEFSRPEIVAALTSQLTERFAANVAQRLGTAPADRAAAAPPAALEISLARALGHWLASRLAPVRAVIRRAGARRPGATRH